VNLLVLVLIGCLVAVAAVLFVLSFRRDRPVLGLAGLTTMIVAAFMALPYSGLQDF
jgi:hypothetical protein